MTVCDMLDIMNLHKTMTCLNVQADCSSSRYYPYQLTSPGHLANIAGRISAFTLNAQ